MNAAGQEVVFDLTTGPPTGYTPLFSPPEVLTNVNNVQGLQSNTPGQAQVGNLGLCHATRCFARNCDTKFRAFTIDY